MFGLESVMSNYLGTNKTLWMIAGLSLLILLNLGTKVIIEHKKKNLNWDDITNFMKPLLLYIVLLVGLEFLVVAGSGVEVLHTFFLGLQFFGFGIVATKYFKKVYGNLKELGMPQSELLDKKFEERMNRVGDINRNEFETLVDIYLEKKKKEKRTK